MREGHLEEIHVDLAGDEFIEKSVPASQRLLDYFERLGIRLPDGYRTEVNLDIRPWLAEVSRALAEGFVLTIDYGYPAHEYYSPDRHRGTLICYRGHRADEHPYLDVGDRDITAHVNFTALRDWGAELGLRCLGYTRQGPYLVSLGIGGVLEELHGGGPDYEEQARKVHGLVLPAGMGESHKVMLQYKGPERAMALAGFALRNEVRGLD
jgi:SAM-dependent MidA family methyltransferase